MRQTYAKPLNVPEPFTNFCSSHSQPSSRINNILAAGFLSNALPNPSPTPENSQYSIERAADRSTNPLFFVTIIESVSATSATTLHTNGYKFINRWKTATGWLSLRTAPSKPAQSARRARLTQISARKSTPTHPLQSGSYDQQKRAHLPRIPHRACEPERRVYQVRRPGMREEVLGYLFSIRRWVCDADGWVLRAFRISLRRQGPFHISGVDWTLQITRWDI